MNEHEIIDEILEKGSPIIRTIVYCKISDNAVELINNKCPGCDELLVEW